MRGLKPPPPSGELDAFFEALKEVVLGFLDADIFELAGGDGVLEQLQNGPA
jgi:hypothetical protein